MNDFFETILRKKKIFNLFPKPGFWNLNYGGPSWSTFQIEAVAPQILPTIMFTYIFTTAIIYSL